MLYLHYFIEVMCESFAGLNLSLSDEKKGLKRTGLVSILAVAMTKQREDTWSCPEIHNAKLAISKTPLHDQLGSSQAAWRQPYGGMYQPNIPTSVEVESRVTKLHYVHAYLVLKKFY